MHKIKFLITLILLTIISYSTSAEMVYDPVLQTDIIKVEPAKKQNYNVIFKKKVANAINKFENLNIKISYDDFNNLILDNPKSDFYLLTLANKTAELGFFDLSNLAYSKIEDLDISSINIEETKKFYYPKNNINKQDTIILAELYSNILYNDQAKETVQELERYPNLLKQYDYANYIMALGYFKLNDRTKAKQYIDIATQINPTNINYKILKAQIYTGEKKGKETKKLLKEINSEKFTIANITNKIKSSNEYTLYLLATKPQDKDYHLGNFYYTEGNYSKANRIFMTSITKNKKNNSKMFSMISRCYLAQGDYSKAYEYAQKAYSITTSNPNSLITLGDIEAKNGNYKTAIKYYKDASSNKEFRQESLEKIAGAYIKTSNTKKANDIYNELINNYPNSYIAHYKIGLITPSKEIEYLKKSVSINSAFEEGWIDLARIMLDNNNLKLAKDYLLVANYLDDNNFRYYYYQSLLKKKEAEFNSIKNSSKDINKVASK